MLKLINRRSLYVSAALVAGMMSSTSAYAADSNFSTIAGNIVESMAELPGLLSAVAYMFGILLGVLGILKIKDHVENPGQTPLKDGAIRLAAGGGLFALPIVYDAMLNTIGNTDANPVAAQLQGVSFGVVGTN